MPLLIDLDRDVSRQVVVDREKGQYLGHPTTLLLPDGKTMLCVYPKGHGRGAIQLKKSFDGGKTWTDRLPTPENWATSLETPTLHRLIDKKGKARIILWSGLNPARIAVSGDDGKSWSPLRAVGTWGGIVTMSSVERLRDGRYVALFHDDGRFFLPEGQKATGTMTLYQTFSSDGGLTWTYPQAIWGDDSIHLCEPGAVRSPDGKTLAVLLRENRRVRNSHVMFTSDECKTWSWPRELPRALTGDRHVAKYAPDGRLVVTFRDMAAGSETFGDWVAWVGTWEDIVNGRPGQYRVRLKDNQDGSDCGYAGLELLPDGTFVATTYGHWISGEEPYILSVRFSLKDIDKLASRER